MLRLELILGLVEFLYFSSMHSYGNMLSQVLDS